MLFRKPDLHAPTDYPPRKELAISLVLAAMKALGIGVQGRQPASARLPDLVFLTMGRSIWNGKKVGIGQLSLISLISSRMRLHEPRLTSQAEGSEAEPRHRSYSF